MPNSTGDDLDTLGSLLSSLDLSKPFAPTSSDLQAVLEVFSNAEHSKNDQRKAYAYLARLLIPSKPGTASEDTFTAKKDASIRSTAKIISIWLSESTPVEMSKAFASLSAILQIDVDSFSRLVELEGVEYSLTEVAETISGEFKIVNEQELQNAQRHFVLLSSNAAGYSKSKALARKMVAATEGWVAKKYAAPETDEEIKTAIVVTYIKLHAKENTAANGDAANTDAKDDLGLPPRDTLLRDLMRFYTGPSTLSTSAASTTLEGLALLSLRPSMRRIIVQDAGFLSKLLKVEQLAQSADLAFSIASIISSLLAYHRTTEEDEKTKERMRKWAAAGAGAASEPKEEDEDDDEIASRNEQTLKAGIMPLIVLLAKHTSPTVRQLTANILLSLVDKTSLRPVIIQQGGARALINIIAATKFPELKADGSPADFVSIQALAKLLITNNPAMVIGGGEGLVGVSIPLTLPILHPSATLLQQFECLMALTNVAGLSEAARERIANVEGFLSRMEDIMLEGNSETHADDSEEEIDTATETGLDGKGMCRRAATELLCNVVPCETAFNRYTAFDQLESLKDGRLPPAVASRLHLIIALGDSRDNKTRGAALGALTNLLLAPPAAAFVVSDIKRLGIIVTATTDANPMVHSAAIVCLRNLVVADVGKSEEMKSMLSTLAREGSASIKEAATEAIADLSEQ